MLGLKLSRYLVRPLRTAGVRFLSLPAHEVVGMPALSPTMQAGTIGKWLMKEGDSCTAGDAIAEVETDKASMAFEVQDDFFIAKILVAEGAEVPVGGALFVSVEDEGDIGAFANFEAPAGAVAAVPAPAAAPTPAAVPVATAPAPVTVATPTRSSGERVFASPLARRLARDAGVDINSLQGSGPNGRIVAADVQNAPVGTSAAAAVQGRIATTTAAGMTQGIGSTGAYSDFELSNLAQSVAGRYTSAKQVVPHYYLTVDLNLAKLVQMRADLGGDISMVNFFMKAAAGAMKQVPDVNGAWMDSFVRQYEQVDINLVMGSGEGLITPVIRDVGGKGVRGLSQELDALEDSLFSDEEGEAISSTAELAPGTFSIHNLGMYGIKTGSPIVLPPQSCALALGTITDTVVPHPDTKWAVQPSMSCTLSCDHRVVDGAVAAQWLSAFKVLVENPVGLML